MIVTMTISSDVTDVWQYNYNITLTLTLDLRIKKSKEKRKRKLNKKARVQALYIWQLHFLILLLSPHMVPYISLSTSSLVFF